MGILKIISTMDTEALASLGYSESDRALKDLTLLSVGPFEEVLNELSSGALRSASPVKALNNLGLMLKSVEDDDIERVLKQDGALHFLITLCGSSELFTRTICKHPELIGELFFGGREGSIYRRKDLDLFLSELGELVGGSTDRDEVARSLRVYKHKEYVRIGLRDLAKLSPIEEVTAEISDLASASLEVALDFSHRALVERYGAPLFTDENGTQRAVGFTILGMGKLGGRELNFSSDIDLIYIYESSAGESAGTGDKESTKIGLHHFFVKLAEKVTGLINEITNDGNVFRVDLNLRPEGRSGEIVCSIDAAELYYESWGQTWERSAMIKARPVAGSSALGRNFLGMIEPFVYRKYLDFRAIEELKTMKERVDIDLKRRKPDTIDVKLGKGGIREIEFFCQALQLIHGGRVSAIREKNTLTAIEKLVKEGLLEAPLAYGLTDAYRFLRQVEHRVQTIEGLQTHALPEKSAEVERIARMMSRASNEGVPEGGANAATEGFIDEYRKITAGVYDIYRTLFYSGAEELDGKVDDEILLLFSTNITEDEIIDRLDALGAFKDPERAASALAMLREGKPGTRLSQSARQMLQKIAPFLFAKTLETPDPEAALFHLEAFLSVIGAQTTFYALLSENLKVAELLITIFGTSEFLSRTLLEQPGATDHLLSNDLTTPRKTKEELAEELRLLMESAGWSEGGDVAGVYEELLDTMRRFKGREILRIGINDILGELDISGVTGQMTSLGEVILDSAVSLGRSELSGRFGSPGGGDEEAHFAVIGLGKLGAGELIYGSDLDIVFVYSDPADGAEVTTGPKVISNHEYFVKLGQRVISILTLKTKEGDLFAVDMRLRPSGSSGPLVVTRSSLLKYQSEKAEIWEAQAMLRARGVAGDIGFARDVTGSLQEIVFNRGLGDSELLEIGRIRERMENEIANEGPGRYNIKTGCGASVDIEFLIQALQLREGPKERTLRTPNTFSALDALVEAGLISAGDHLVLREAYTFFTTIACKLRIVHDRSEGTITEGSKELATLVRRLGYNAGDGARTFLTDYLALREKVREIYKRNFALD